MTGRRGKWGSFLTAAVVIAAGFGVALVEAYRLPKGSIWFVVGAAVLLVLLIRWFGARKP